MTFTSLDYFLFFFTFMVVYSLIGAMARRYLILVSSYMFYGYYEPWYVFLLFGSSYLDYRIALKIHDSATAVGKKNYLHLSVFVNFGALFIFKYSNFFFDNVSVISGISFFQVDLLLPIGISFYTFQTVSYCIDVYRGQIKPERNLLNFLIYVSFFPQLIAGPIERAGRLLTQINAGPLMSLERLRRGTFLILYGLFIKLAIANNLTYPVLELVKNPQGAGIIALTLVGTLFLFKLYADFLGYTEIARGVASLMGYQLSENFRRPFFATSTREFWQRWHISLTSWIGDYVNKPLRERYQNSWMKRYIVIFVMILVGLWHGAGWNFFFYGLIQGLTMFLWIPIANFLNASLAPGETTKKLFGWFFMYLSIWACGPLFFITDYNQYSVFMTELLSLDTGSAISGLANFPGKIQLVAAALAIVIMLTKDLREEFSGDPNLETLAGKGGPLFYTMCCFLILCIVSLGKFADEEFIYYAF